MVRVSRPESAAPAYSLTQRLAAWGVHALTMTGIVWACLALLALLRNDLVEMWGWLGVALIVDGLDGTLARRAKVTERVPWFDGSALDLIVDYLTWTFIPALFMYRCLPLGPDPVPGLVLIVVCASSLFCYCNKQMKSTDYYFVGFPAAWNVVAVHMWLLGTGWVFNLVATLVLAVLTLVPIQFVHPFRVRRLMIVNIVAVLAWLVAIVCQTLVYPERQLPAQLLMWIGGGWFLLAGFARTLRRRADPAA
ncbi:phosphatidylcholine synthase [Enemella dayhoffiae]|uniref:Phosphatidylcholine synthase n=1 Tax=Enemella dayhoffiae TaxID=2016507 RepID=A0A255H6F2_9ACTN|nr:phosphatidylcholine synthase [Enemella dayhoffiae]